MNSQLVAAARTMLGVRFMHQGRHPELGLDCAGLAVCSARACGYEVIDNPEYKRAPDSSFFLEFLRANCDQVQPGDERPGDFFIFATPNRGPQHLAIMTESEPPAMIHAHGPQGKVVEHNIDAAWLRQRRHIFRIKEK
ncbi:NlpC/P60 family protein [Massilia sp. P8910]|uniref:C40 family peptidase n=1 Tax=Massilia antarctica TaxID=2765360 RepID=UPI001E44B774|nr:NlpC/P60 family protein [Massilia antarctica]MCE3608080.1 NlpC/P60 family protein [Massilia antarctica]